MKLIKSVQAAINNPVIDPGLRNQMVNDPKEYVSNVAQTLFSIFMVVGVIYFIWHFIMAAYHFISSEGDPKKIEDAKHALTYSALGLFLVFAVFAILKVIGTIFGVTGLDTLKLTLPSLKV